MLRKSREKEDITASIAAIRERYMEIINGLGLSLSLDDQFEVISENFKNWQVPIMLLPEENT